MSRLAASLIIVSVALGARLGAAYLPGAQPLQPTESSAVAANLNSGRGYIFEQYGTIHHAWKEPLHIVLLAGWVRATGGSDALIRLLQAACAAIAALLVAWLAVRLTGRPAAALPAGLLAALNPFLLYYDTQWIHPLSFDAALAMGLLAALLRALEDAPAGGRWAILAGSLLGAALWQRSTFFAPCAVFWAAAVMGRGRRLMMARRAAVCLSLGALLIAPWLWRNYRHYGRVVMTTDTGHILWLGNNPRSNGTYSDATGRRIFHTADAAFQASIYGATELEQQERFLDEVRRFVRTQPLAYLRLVARRLLAFVWLSPNAGVTYAPWQRVVYLCAYVPLLLLGAWGAIECWGRAAPPQRTALLAAGVFIAGLAVFHALTAINLKHRVPFELLLSAFAGERLAAGWAWGAARRLRRHAHAC